MRHEFASWSPDYTEARQKFREAGKQAGFELRAHPLNPQAHLQDGLYIDEAYRGPKWPEKLLIVTSGVHGIEGFAGSAIQIETFKEVLQENLPSGVGVLYVHGLNPYGFAHYSRTNEENIDINRNFIDWDSTPPKSHTLTKLLADMMLSKSNPPGILKFVTFILRHGFENAKQALTGGQYEFPKSLYFGGQQGFAQSTIIWDNIIKAHSMMSRPDIMHIDLHTGLGTFAKGEIMVSEEKSSPAYRAVSSWWPDATSIADGTSSSSVLNGDINNVFKRRAGEFSSAVSLTLEFGTRGPIEIVKALAMENWTRVFAPEGKWRDRARAAMLRAFNPQEESWRIPVTQRGVDVIKQGISGFGSISPR